MQPEIRLEILPSRLRHDLSAAAGKLGVSINTVRTHLQRMFDKTGVHTQSALVGLLLSAEAPTAR